MFITETRCHALALWCNRRRCCHMVSEYNTISACCLQKHDTLHWRCVITDDDAVTWSVIIAQSLRVAYCLQKHGTLHWRCIITDDDGVTWSVSITIYRCFLQKHDPLCWRCAITDDDAVTWSVSITFYRHFLHSMVVSYRNTVTCMMVSHDQWVYQSLRLTYRTMVPALAFWRSRWRCCHMLSEFNNL